MIQLSNINNLFSDCNNNHHLKLVNKTKEDLIKNVAKNTILKKDLNMSLIERSGVFVNQEAENLYQKINSSEIVISFNGKYIKSILENGYVHWSQLPSSSNTENADLLIERLQAEKEIFGIHFYNKNILNKIVKLMEQNKQAFTHKWNERFELDANASSAEELLQSSGFIPISDAVHYGPIYGSLYDNGDELIYSGTKPDMSKTYAKSKIYINSNLVQSRTTYAIGDTFDSSPCTYAWKNAEDKDRSSVLFTLSDKDNVINRLMSSSIDIPYIESHTHGPITAKEFSKVFIDSSEYPEITDEAENLMETYNVGIIYK